MKQKFLSLLMVVAILVASGCASIVSKSSYPITISSDPSEAKITITDKGGVEIYQGKTPASLKLDASDGFFSKAHYQVKFEKEGYNVRTVPVEFGLDGWYFGNILIGGVIGMLIIDPATGAMYKLERPRINQTLDKEGNTANAERASLKVYDINDIPEKWKSDLTKVTQ